MYTTIPVNSPELFVAEKIETTITNTFEMLISINKVSAKL
jgi:hypothetical protein